MKFDTAQIASSIPGDTELSGAMGLDPRAPLLVAGSTGPGEENLLLDAFIALGEEISGLQMAIIPRKPERFDEVARLITSRGLTCRRRSAHPDGGHDAPEAEAGTIFLGDTMGELRKFYVLADAVFVGRSLVPLGGSDLIEVAALARAMCYGPHVQNFAEIAEQLVQAEAALQMGGEGELIPTLRALLRDRSRAHAMGQRAQDVVRRNQGATARTVDLLCSSLERMPHPCN